MTMPVDANSWLMSGGTPYVRFDNIGDAVVGMIKEKPTLSAQTDINTGDVLHWPNGQVKQQMIVIMSTDERDPAVTDDDGTRTLYVKGYMQNALRDAVKSAGVPGIEIGGKLTVTYTSDGEQTTKGFNKPKMFHAAYLPPDAVQANEFIGAPDAFAKMAPAGNPKPQSPPINAGNGTVSAPQGSVSTNGGTPAWALSPEQRAALVGIGGDVDALEARRKAAFELGIDPNMVKLNA